jgi:hypothetical protein
MAELYDIQTSEVGDLIQQKIVDFQLIGDNFGYVQHRKSVSPSTPFVSYMDFYNNNLVMAYEKLKVIVTLRGKVSCKRD